MEVNFTELFDKESRDNFKISRESVREAIETPLNLEEIVYKGLRLQFFTKEIDNNRLLLVLARKVENKIVVDLAFQVKMGLAKALKIQQPTLVLQRLVEKYGLVVTVGNISRKFIIAQEIDLKPEQVTNLVKVKNPDNHSFVTSMDIKINKNKTKVECVLVFALDTDRYLDWIRN